MSSRKEYSPDLERFLSAFTQDTSEEKHKILGHWLDSDESLTPLGFAVTYSEQAVYYDMAERILKEGVEDVNSVVDSVTLDTALHIALRCNDSLTARLLLNHGADISLRNAQGETAIDAYYGGEKTADIKAMLDTFYEISCMIDISIEHDTRKPVYSIKHRVRPQELNLSPRLREEVADIDMMLRRPPTERKMDDDPSQSMDKRVTTEEPFSHVESLRLQDIASKSMRTPG